MSGLEILTKLVPFGYQPEVAVVILTNLTLASLAEVAMMNGAQACLLNTHASSDVLDRVIQKAIAAVGPIHKDRHSRI